MTHESHDMIRLESDFTYTCSRCYACVCHKADVLEEPCTQDPSKTDTPTEKE